MNNLQGTLSIYPGWDRFVTPEQFGAVDAEGVIRPDAFREMIEYAADNAMSVRFTQDYTFAFVPGSVPRTLAKNGIYIYDNPSPVVVSIEGKSGIMIDGAGHTVRMTGLTRKYQERFRYSDIGGLSEFFTFLSFRACENVTVENMIINGEYIFDAAGERAGETETNPAADMAVVNPARVADVIAAVGERGYSTDDYTFQTYHLGYYTTRAVGIKFRTDCRHCTVRNVHGSGILGNLVNMVSSGVFDITVDGCSATSMLENCFNNMAGPYAVKYTNCTMFNSLQGIETGNSASGGATDFDFYGSDGTSEYTTLISNCYFRRVKLGLVMEGADICAGSAFYESTAKVNGCARGTFTGCIFRLDRSCEIQSGARVIFDGCQFRYPRLDSLIRSTEGANKSASVWYDWNSFTTNAEGYRTLRPYYIYAWKPAGSVRGPDLAFAGCRFYMDYPDEMNGYPLRYKNAVSGAWVDVDFNPALYFSECRVTFGDCRFYAGEDNPVILLHPQDGCSARDCDGLRFLPALPGIPDEMKIDAMWELLTVETEKTVELSPEDWVQQKLVYYDDGSVSQSLSPSTKLTDNIPVPQGAVSMTYTQMESTSTTSRSGIAFYNELGEEFPLADRYISGERLNIGQESNGARMHTVDVPDGARFVRVTYWRNEDGMLPFSCTFTVKELREDLAEA